MAGAKTACSSKPRENATPEQVDRMFRAFCDRTRLRILSLLQDGEFCVGDIVAILDVPQAVSHSFPKPLFPRRRRGGWFSARIIHTVLQWVLDSDDQ